MFKHFIKFITLCLGVSIGIFLSMKINLLGSVNTDSKLYKVSNEVNVNNPSIRESSEFNKDLVISNSVYKDFVIDLKYATTDNISKTKLYSSNTCYLQRGTLKKLIAANEELLNMGYRIKIWDGYRPLSVQKKLWAILPNSNYIANPFRGGSNHNRGAAVDITLVDLQGNELHMPTGFDEFGAKSSRAYKGNSAASEKLSILTDVMVRNGFTTIRTEWWHFDDADYGKYPVMDLSIDTLLKK